jgi:hypothetical protein
MSHPVSSMIVRGKVIGSDLIEFTGRGDAITFMAPDPHKFVDQLPLSHPAQLADLYALSFEEILDYLDELGHRLDIQTNAYMQEARELTYRTAPVTRPLTDALYRRMGRSLDRGSVRQMAEKTVGINYLEGWVREQPFLDGTGVYIRAFGSRQLHIVAGNAPLAVLTLARAAITRSDCIIKAPSNDPFTGAALAKTMCDMAPDHPITRHFSVAYWRGGDEAFEKKLYTPNNIEKIIAWGGLNSIKHVTKYIRPGLEVISLDPKLSISIIDGTKLTNDAQVREAALRVAIDGGKFNQVGCASARVVYIITGSGAGALNQANRLGALVYEELLSLPDTLSTKPKSYDRTLRSHVDALRLDDEYYKVIGGENDEGCVIVSQVPEPVEFAAYLADRTINIVPVESLQDVMAGVNAYTQTVGIWPEALKESLLNSLPLWGAQRFVTLGNAIGSSFAKPQDGIEPVRRMCKWIINEVEPPAISGAEPIEGTAAFEAMRKRLLSRVGHFSG